MANEKLIAKIRALRAKTVANGATEQEAVSAAEKAAALMREAGLGAADLDYSEARATARERRHTWRTIINSAAAWATNTVGVRDVAHDQIIFVGVSPGPDIAAYLREVCIRAVETALNEFKASTAYLRRRSLATRRAAAADFAAAMAMRLAHRIQMLFAPTRRADHQGAAHSMVAARFGALETRKIKPRNGRFGDASAAGWSAGERVALNHGVAATQPLAIGGA
jgi:hypothetical protein